MLNSTPDSSCLKLMSSMRTSLRAGLGLGRGLGTGVMVGVAVTTCWTGAAVAAAVGTAVVGTAVGTAVGVLSSGLVEPFLTGDKLIGSSSSPVESAKQGDASDSAATPINIEAKKSLLGSRAMRPLELMINCRQLGNIPNLH